MTNISYATEQFNCVRLANLNQPFNYKEMKDLLSFIPYYTLTFALLVKKKIIRRDKKIYYFQSTPLHQDKLNTIISTVRTSQYEKYHSDQNKEKECIEYLKERGYLILSKNSYVI